MIIPVLSWFRPKPKRDFIDYEATRAAAKAGLDAAKARGDTREQHGRQAELISLTTKALAREVRR